MNVPMVRPRTLPTETSAALRQAFDHALDQAPEAAADLFAAALAPHISIAVFLYNQEGDDVPEDIMFIGKDVGVLMLSGELSSFGSQSGADTAKLFLCGALTQNSGLEVSVTRNFGAYGKAVSLDIRAFFMSLETALASHDVSVNRTIPSTPASPGGHGPNGRSYLKLISLPSGIPLPRKPYLVAGGIVVLAFLALHSLFSHHQRHPGFSPPNPVMIGGTQLNGPINPAASSVQITVGGHGPGGLDLKAFGINTGPEVSKN